MSRSPYFVRPCVGLVISILKEMVLEMLEQPAHWPDHGQCPPDWSSPIAVEVSEQHPFA